ncbi:MAG: hypothetical protein IJ518_05230 [Clostridia bacterium]|nr:hypothetical protein [Clostridia bacterium]
MRAGWRWLAALLALTLLLSGCSLDVESFLQPPRMQGEQQAVQAALETYLRDSGAMKLGLYTLKYPTVGEHTSAFVLCDGAGQPLDASAATAQMAVAFYALASAPEETHINLLYRNGTEWVSMGDCIGSGTDIRQVAFGDLDGDGTEELLAGWSTYNSRDHRLAVYTMTDGLTLLADDRLYTSLFVGDMTTAGRDELLLLHSGGEGVTASLEQFRDGRLHNAGTVALDGKIQQFGNMTFCRLAEGVQGLYVDAAKSDDTTITELIYYDDRGLHAPFYDGVAGATTVTGRSGGLISRDVDGDGLLEIPVTRPWGQPAQAPAHVAELLTVWRGWDYSSRTFHDRLLTVTNPTDGYAVVLDTAQTEKLSSRYMADTHTLQLTQRDTGEGWLWLCAGATMNEAPREGLASVVLWTDTAGKPACVAWFDATQTDAEKVRYMVLRLTE